MRKAIAAGVLVSCLAAPSPALAQAMVVAPQPVAVGDTSLSPALVRGSRVRIKSTAIPDRTSGLVVALDERFVTLETNRGRVQIPVTSIKSLETSTGQKRNGLKGAAVGAIAGLAFGLIATVDPTPTYGNFVSACAAFCSRATAVGVGIGTLGSLGLVMGALSKTDRWRVVTLTDSTPAPQGTRLERTAR